MYQEKYENKSICQALREFSTKQIKFDAVLLLWIMNEVAQVEYCVNTDRKGFLKKIRKKI